MGVTTKGKRKAPTQDEFQPPNLAEKFECPFNIINNSEGDRFTTLRNRTYAQPRDFKLDEIEESVAETQDSHYLKVLKNIHTMGGIKLGKLPSVTYEALTLEFLSTFDKVKDGGFYCRLKNEKVVATKRELLEEFGLDYTGEEISTRTRLEGYDDDEWWMKLSGLPRNGEDRLRATLITDDVLLATYKYLAHIMFSKDEASKLNKLERQILWCVDKGRKPCLTPLIFQAIKRIPTIPNGRLLFGPIASALALKRGLAITNDTMVDVLEGKLGPRTKREGAPLTPDFGGQDSPRAHFDLGQSSRAQPDLERPHDDLPTPPQRIPPTQFENEPLCGWQTYITGQNTIIATLNQIQGSVDYLTTQVGTLRTDFDEHREYVRQRLPEHPLEGYQNSDAFMTDNFNNVGYERNDNSGNGGRGHDQGEEFGAPGNQKLVHVHDYSGKRINEVINVEDDKKKDDDNGDGTENMDGDYDEFRST